jgi:hypothetical protein
VNVEVNSLHVKRIAIEDLVGYVYIVRVDASRSSSRPKRVETKGLLLKGGKDRTNDLLINEVDVCDIPPLSKDG